ncbi:MAG: dTDP-4-dehydrorhamnose 3,5-epimerase family protein [Rhizomicrobium sp.]
MIFEPLVIPGAFKITAEPHRDNRGSFARLYCPAEFAAHGIEFGSTQINMSTNARRHTLRGLHYQLPPHAESKFVHAVHGRAFDVVLDLRPDSPSYRRWVSVEIGAEGIVAVFIPEGCAHGFLTLEDDTSILYQMGRPFVPGQDRGVRWNDPAFGIDWPAAPAVMSERDAAYPDFVEHGQRQVS